MQLSGVFRKTTVADFVKSELALNYSKGVLDLCAYAGLELLVSLADSAGFQLREHPGFARPHGNVPVGFCGQSLLNPPIPRVRKDIGLMSVQERLSLGDVMHIGRSTRKAVDQPGLGIHPYVGLHAEVPLIALFSLMHLRVPGTRSVLGRAWCRNDRGIHNRAPGEPHATACQVTVNCLKDLGSQPTTFQQMPKVQNGCFIRHRPLGQRQPRKLAHRGNLIQSLFHSRVTQPVPLLHKVNPKHGTQFIGPSAIARLGVDRFNQTLDLFSGNHPIHVGQKDLTPRLLALDSVLCIGETHLAHTAYPRKKNMNIRQSQS